MAENSSSRTVLGLRANLLQFSLLVLVNAFVGSMVGIERSILPLVASEEFGITSRSAIFSFLISFGIVKGVSNLFAGRLSDAVGRKKLLVAGWLVGLPVPFLLAWAHSWSWIVIANILLGVNQGLCWSTTVFMKIDLVGPARRGLAIGLNEFAGYAALAGTAFWSASIAANSGLRPYPFYPAIASGILGLVVSLLFVRDTHAHALHEAARDPDPRAGKISMKEVFLKASWRDKNLFSCSQAGFVNNVNDSVAWSAFPLLFASLGFSLSRIGFLTALYPAVWGIGQLGTGLLSDWIGRKWMIAAGLWMQAAGLCLMVIPSRPELFCMVLLGVGTAMVYPVLLAAVGDNTRPEQRASTVGVYRLWRDLGYAAGAFLSGILADLWGLDQTILAVGVMTALSGGVVAARLSESRPQAVEFL